MATELVRMFAHPPQGLDQIELAHVARIGEPRIAQLCQVQVAEHIEPVVDGDHHHIATLAQRAAVVLRVAAGAVVVGATVDVEQDRPRLAVAQRRRPHVEVQAVFAAGAVLLAALRRGRPVGQCIAHPAPRQFRQCRLEAPGRGVRAIGHAKETVHALVIPAAQAAAAHLRQ